MSDFLISPHERSGHFAARNKVQDSPGAAPDGVPMDTGSMVFERSLLTREASGHTSRLHVYQGQVEALQAQLNGLQAHFKSVSGDIAGRIAGLEQELAAIYSLLARAMPEGQGQTVTLEARKAGLSSQLAVFRHEDYSNEKSNKFDIGALRGAQADVESLARAIEGQLRSIVARIHALQLI
jgi:hypothetical protein